MHNDGAEEARGAIGISPEDLICAAFLHESWVSSPDLPWRIVSSHAFQPG
jgi:hypothetical protein